MKALWPHNARNCASQAKAERERPKAQAEGKRQSAECKRQTLSRERPKAEGKAQTCRASSAEWRLSIYSNFCALKVAARALVASTGGP